MHRRSPFVVRFALAPQHPAPGLGRLTSVITLLLVLSIAAAVGGCARVNTPGMSDSKTTLEFSFDIPNLQTDHQFKGQLNTFRIRYQYATGLKGGGYDPRGHQVNDQTYPYFQQVRTEVTSYVRAYPDKSNFYEVFATDTAQHLMQQYPQLASFTLTIDIPGYGGEPLPRTVTVHVER